MIAKPINKIQCFFNNQKTILFILNGLTALAFSIILPIMSLFLVAELNAKPAFIGIYTTLTALFTVLVSHKLTNFIDKGISSKRILTISLFGIILASISFSFSSEFWHALLIGCTLMPIASSSIPILLTIIRKYADSSGKDSAKLNSQMRSCVSFLWIFGPPLAFISVDKFGFESNFHLSAILALLVIVLVVILLKTPIAGLHTKVTYHSEKLPSIVWLLGCAIFLANMANSSYISSIPIYLTQELGLPKFYPGLLLGITAGVEVPSMLLAVHWAQRFGKMPVLKFGFIIGMMFYISMYFSSSFSMFIALQIFNGLFFGIFVGLGITIVQDLTPQQIGKASAFYTNAMLVGSMLGTSCMGIIAQYFGFKAPLLLSFIAMIFSFLALIYFEKKSVVDINELTPQRA